MLRFLKFALISSAFCALILSAVFYRYPLAFADSIVRFHLYRQHVESRYIQVDGHTIHYLEAQPVHKTPGQADAPPILLIHGLGARAEDWSPMIPTLAAQGFHVYALDLLGYGRSAKPDVDYSIALQEQTVTDFISALHLPAADVAGWSMGGWVALSLTIDHPALVKRLIVMDSAGIYFPATFNASLFTPTDGPGLTRLIDKLTPHPIALPPFAQRAAVRKLQSNAWIIDRAVASMTAGRDLLDFRLQKIAVPTLVVWGDQDRLIPLAVGQSLHQKIPDSSLLIVQGCGHLAPGECTKPILRATTQFLRATPPLAPYEVSVPGEAVKAQVDSPRQTVATRRAGEFIFPINLSPVRISEP